MNRFRILALLAFAISLALALPALAAEGSHDLVLLRLDTPGAEAFFTANRNALDVIRVKPGQYVTIAATAEATDLIRQAGQSFEVITKNMEEKYAADKGIGFGIYHTYSESAAFQDSLRLRFPNLVSQKWSIGQTGEGRDIWCFKVSANPDIDEDEPEILIDGMHHAREIMASEFNIMFAEYLAENYGTDPEITWLLDNRELYVIPIMNPDGVVYNESTDPNGGGMWRKNRRNNGGGIYGVDINRNYPYRWGYDNNGSSGYPGDLTYRGPSAGSEPETQAIMNFINGRNIVTHDTIHTYSNLLLYPWGYISTPSPDNAIFEHMGQIMTQYNGYEWGQPGNVLYTVNGGTFDWAYGDQTFHNKIFSFSTEIGQTGFWPAESERGSLFQENIWPHIYLMRVAGPFIAVHSPVVMGQALSIAPGQTGNLNFTIENQSVVASALDLSITVSTDDPWVQLGGAEFAIGDLASMASTTLSAGALPISVDAACPDGHLVPFTVTVHMADGDMPFTLSFMVGSPNLVFSDNFEGGLGNFTHTGNWGLTSSSFHSAVSSLTDSPAGNYSDNSTTYATLNGSYQATTLTFWHKYDIESGWDYGRVLVSNNGTTWNTLASYTGTQSGWQQVSLDLGSYAGQNLRFRFQLETDYSVTKDGWYIDDVQIIGAGNDNLAPNTPIAISPAEGSTTSTTPELTVGNVTDPEGAAVVYGFRIYSDAMCTQLAAASDDQTQGDGQTSWTSGALAPGSYWWRAYAGDGEQRSLLSAPIMFTANGVTAADDMIIAGLDLKVLGQSASGGARLQLNLPASGKVTLDIYDVRGARIRQLHTGQMDAGVQVLTWDGRDNTGRNTSSGVYFLRLVAGTEVRTGRLVVVR